MLSPLALSLKFTWSVPWSVSWSAMNFRKPPAAMKDNAGITVLVGTVAVSVRFRPLNAMGESAGLKSSNQSLPLEGLAIHSLIFTDVATLVAFATLAAFALGRFSIHPPVASGTRPTE